MQSLINQIQGLSKVAAISLIPCHGPSPLQLLCGRV